MSESSPSAAAEALGELLEVSPQVTATVLVTRASGEAITSAPARMERLADQFGATCTSLLDAAEQARVELGREPVTQCEVATERGHVFVVADETHVIGAVTTNDPTVGLVFYDLKTALRTVREAGGSSLASEDDASHAFGTTGIVIPVVSTDHDEVPTDAHDAARDEAIPFADVDAGQDENDDTDGDGVGDGDGDEHAPENGSRMTSRWRKR